MQISDIPASVRTRAPHLIEKLGDIELPDPQGWQLLCLQYTRPDKIGSLYVASKTQDEDKYQGRIGLVLACGPDCWSDERRFTSGARCLPGDVVIWPSAGAAAQRFEYSGVTLALMPDTSILATIPDGVDLSRVVGG